MYAVFGATGNTGSVVAKELLAPWAKSASDWQEFRSLQPLAKLGAEPVLADITDTSTLVRALTGARAAYVIIPPNVRSEDVKAESERVSDALASAIEKSPNPTYGCSEQHWGRQN